MTTADPATAVSCSQEANAPTDDGSAAGNLLTLRDRERWWTPVLGVAVMAAIFFTMPQWMPAVHFLSAGEGVVVVLYSMLALGMVLVLGYCGQLMLATNAFFGVGAYGLAILAVHQGMNAWVGLVVSAVAVGVLALLLGVLAFRLRGHMLGLVTLVIGYVAYIIFQTAPITGGASGMSAGPGFAVGSLSLIGGTNAFFYFCAGASLLALIVARNLVTSRTGRALRAVQASEPAASSAGINPTRYKVIAFVVGAMMAAVAGSLYAGYVGVVGSDSFSILLTVEILLMAVVGGLRSVWGAPIGVLLVVVFEQALQTYGPDVVHISASYFSTIGFGVVLILVLLFIPGGLSGLGQRLWARVDRRGMRSAVAPPSTGRAMVPPAPSLPDQVSAPPIRLVHEAESGPATPALEALGITCRFGGLLALDEVGVAVREGEVLGLIGPNGAGKTTFFNCLSGHVRPDAGTVCLNGVDVTGMASYRIARHGLARTFQNVELFTDMTVLENVMVGGHLTEHAGTISAILRLPRYWTDLRVSSARALAALDRVGMTGAAFQLAAALPYGQQRRMDIARALAAEPRVLLLDEPAAGLTEEEAEDLVRLVRTLAEESLAVVLVEHNMRALLNAADRVTVLASGRQIITDAPEVVRRDPAVIASYLGTSGKVFDEAPVTAHAGPKGER